MVDDTTAIDDLDLCPAILPAVRACTHTSHNAYCVDPTVFCLETKRLAARAFVVSAADIGARGCGTRRTSRARQVAMYLSNVAGGVTLGRVGHQFGRNRRTAAHACAVVEDLRDDPDVDLALTMLEGALRAVFRLGTPAIGAPSTFLPNLCKVSPTMMHCPIPSPATRRLLRKLTARDAWLAVTPPRESDEARRNEGSEAVVYRLMPSGRGAGAPVPAHAVREAAAHGWLAAGEGRMTLSAAGAECLRRALSDSGGAKPAKDASAAVPVARRVRHVVAPVAERPGLDEAESPLGWLRRRKDKNGAPLIDDAQFAAGERLRADVFFAGLGARVTMDWGRSGAAPKVRSTSGGSASMLDNMVAARQRVDHAMRAVGPEMSGLLLDVCGFMKGLEVVELERGWPARSARIVLLHGLSMLARHYGMELPARAVAPGRARIRHWGADDFRPDLSSWSGEDTGDRGAPRSQIN